MNINVTIPELFKKNNSFGIKNDDNWEFLFFNVSLFELMLWTDIIVSQNKKDGTNHRSIWRVDTTDVATSIFNEHGITTNLKRLGCVSYR